MTVLYFDGSFEGLISGVFDAYQMKIKEVKFIPENQKTNDLFADSFHISFDEEKFERVRKKLEEILGKSGINDLWKATLSEEEGIYDLIFRIIQYSLKTKQNILSDYGNPDVADFQKILKKISRERHRMTAFVRFKLAEDGVYYAVIEPDFDVLPLISRHFKSRYADQKWLIWDSRRNYGIYYDLKTVVPVEINATENSSVPALPSLEWDASETEFQQLWKKYFKATNIPSRKNTKLHLQHVPKRYWRYLIEK